MIRKIINFFEIIGYSRAAAELARMGKLEEAKQLMLQRKVAERTYRELSALTDKELKDIGISRGDIYNISYQNQQNA